MRQSISLDHFNNDDESLLLATSIPIPDDDDSDRDDFNPVTFSTPFELYYPKSNSQAASPKSIGSKPMVMSNSFNSPPASTPQPIVEDAMRARAEQAESAAERLLELVEPDDEGALDTTIIPASLTKNGHSQYPPPSNGSSQLWHSTAPQVPKTPMNKNAGIMRQAALFQDSPVQNVAKPSLLDLITDKKHERGWWVKRMTRELQSVPAGSQHLNSR
jgi:CLIP-associating protein 1/2